MPARASEQVWSACQCMRLAAVSCLYSCGHSQDATHEGWFNERTLRINSSTNALRHLDPPWFHAPLATVFHSSLTINNYIHKKCVTNSVKQKSDPKWRAELHQQWHCKHWCYRCGVVERSLPLPVSGGFITQTVCCSFSQLMAALVISHIIWVNLWSPMWLVNTSQCSQHFFLCVFCLILTAESFLTNFALKNNLISNCKYS